MTDWKNNLLWLASLAVLGCVFFFRGTADAGAKEAVKAGAKLAGVRTPQEFAAGHIEGAINIPVQEMDARLAEFSPKDGVVVVYCRSGAQRHRQVEAGGRRLQDGPQPRRHGQLVNG
ncbi:MAG: rhodanese-like domain-containing protein [Deltaproteobacteria bacterium]|nr:rhodanese-like domain-containing protein [Deltaproteobacteria bacterium]